MKRYILKRLIFINKIFLVSTFSLFFVSNPSAFAQGIALKILGDFQEGWNMHWIERNLKQLPTQYRMDTNSSEKPAPYRVVDDKKNLVLEMESKEGVIALWRMLNIHPVKFGKIKWQWKVDRSLTHNKKEKQKVGDDYAARLFIVFEPHLLSWKTRALCYVWAGKEPVGSAYKNPYSKSVGTIVVESGNIQAGEWVREERNFVKDYEKFFGEAPKMVSAIAIMVDTDNTQSEAIAWFDEIILELLNIEIKISEKAMKGLKLILKEMQD